ncbi:MAG: radical SAM protein [Methanobacteriales archaeon Met13]
MLQEHNVVVKDPRRVEVRFASCYPNLYRSAMSSLGFHIVYDMLNYREDVYGERVVYPYAKSLETGTTLNNFDIVGFSLQYEEDYIHVLEMLQKGGLNLKKVDRKYDDPLVIAGGPCVTSNPLPMTPFVDLFLVGDGEAILPDFIDTFKELRNPRGELEAFQDIKGVYLPDHPVQINLIKDMGEAWKPVHQVIPETSDKNFIPAFGRSFLLEVSRGCTRGCRFCMAGCLYRPRREVPLDELLETARKGRTTTGLNKIALIGAAVSDHSHIEDLCQNLLEMDFQITLPSLRVEAVNDSLLEILQDSGLKTITLAPESTWNLRKVVNKSLTDDDIFTAVKKTFQHGMNVKLYFLVGLPTETQEDLNDLSKLIKTLKSLAPKNSALRISVNPFIPKPHTPFQWASFNLKEVKQKITYLNREFGSRYFKAESPRTSLVQYVLSVGDAKIGDALEKSLTQKLSLPEWKKLAPQWNLESELPWKNIKVGVDNTFLKEEYSKALDGDFTPWCETFGCYKCGACPD